MNILIMVIHILTKVILTRTVIMSQVSKTIIALTKTDTMDLKAWMTEMKGSIVMLVELHRAVHLNYLLMCQESKPLQMSIGSQIS